MSLSSPVSENDRYDEICRMVGDVSIRTQTFNDEILIYALKNGYDSKIKQSIEYNRIFGDDNTTIQELADKRRVFIHEVVPIVYGGFIEGLLSKDYTEVEKLYYDFIDFYEKECEPLLNVIDEGWYKKTPEEIVDLENKKDKAWIEFLESET